MSSNAMESIINDVLDKYSAEHNQKYIKANLENMKEPVSVLLKREFFKGVRNMLGGMKGFSLEEIIEKAKELKGDLKAYNGWITDRVSAVAEMNGITDRTEIQKIMYLYDNIYIYSTSERFIVDVPYTDVLDYISSASDRIIPEEVEKEDVSLQIKENHVDCLIDFQTPDGKYLPYMVKCTKQNYTMDYGRHKDLEVYSASMIAYRENREEGSPASMVIFQGYIIPELYPKILLESSDYSLCKRAARPELCKRTARKIKENESEKEIATCQITPRTGEITNCPMLMAKPWRMAEYIAYVFDMYANRHTLERKNSKRKNAYVHTKVHVAHDDSSKAGYSIVPLHTYFRQEKENHAWKGGHHASPCEHPRRAGTRRIFNKDGSLKKIVPVKGTIVNKGNTKDRIIHV